MHLKYILIFIIIMVQLTPGICDESDKNILIVYASLGGSTKEIADSMRTYLKEDSCFIDLMPSEKKKIDLSKYDIIIIGSGIYGNNPHPEIIEFIDINRVELSKMKIAVFAVCGTITSSKKKKRDNALTYPTKVAHGLNTISEIVFAGNLISSGKKFDDFMAKLVLGIIPGDYRDWREIKKWTNDINNIVKR